MSIKHVNAVLRGAFGIAPTAKLVLLILAEHAREEGVAWPSVATIARLACISEGYAKHVLQKLEKDKWIVEESKGSGPGRTSRRRLNLAKLMANRVADDTISSGENVSSATPSQQENVPPAAENVSPAARKRVAGSTQAVKNLEEPSISIPPPEENSTRPEDKNIAGPKSSKTKPEDKPSDVDIVAFDERIPAFIVPQSVLAQWRKAFSRIDVHRQLKAAAMYFVQVPARERRTPGRYAVHCLGVANDKLIGRKPESGSYDGEPRVSM